jgi:hypothetical protein
MVVLIIFNRKSIKITTIVLIAALAVLIALGALQISASLGSYSFSFIESIQGTTELDVESDNSADLVWSENSIGRILIADSFSKLIILSPFRILAYIISPLPAIGINISNLFAGDYQEWQHLFTLLSTLYYVFMLSYIIKLFFNRKKDAYALLVLLLFLAVFFTISCGVSIIHERYRILGVPVFLFAIYYGRSLPLYNEKSKCVSMVALITAIVFVFVYKYII